MATVFHSEVSRREGRDHATPAHHPAATTLGSLLASFRLSSLAAHAEEAATDLGRWGAGFPLADARRFGALALTAAVHLPGLSRRERSLAARLNGWIYAFDDLVDGVPVERHAGAGVPPGTRLPDAALDPLAARCAAVVAGAAPRAGESDPGGIVAALGALVGELADRPRPPALVAFWRDSFRRMLAGIIRERRLAAALAAGAPPPSPAAHLETARYSIGAPHYLATCLILHAGADDPALEARLPALIALALAAADIARLANDLRTWVREEREGTYNSIRAADAALASLMPTLPAADRRSQAVLAVERLLAARQARVAGLLGAAPIPRPDAEAGIARLVAFIPALYAAADFHEFDDASPVRDPGGRDGWPGGAGE